MTATTCTCGAHINDDRTLCASCIEQLNVALGNIPALAIELRTALARQQRFTEPNGRNTGNPLPYNLAASRALTRLRDTLTRTLYRCQLQRANPRRTPSDTLNERDIAALSIKLMTRVPYIATQAWAGEALDIVRAVEHSISVIDRPPGHSYAGPCDECGHDLYARDGRNSVTCRDCGLVYDLKARRDWLLQVVDDQLATAVEIARALTSLELPVTAERIRQWKHRERIEIKSHDRLGRPLYRVGDVVDLIVEQAQRSA